MELTAARQRSYAWLAEELTASARANAEDPNSKAEHAHEARLQPLVEPPPASVARSEGHCAHAQESGPNSLNQAPLLARSNRFPVALVHRQLRHQGGRIGLPSLTPEDGQFGLSDNRA